MTPKILTSSHAEDVGGYVVEPGGEIPKGANEDTVKRLEEEGKLRDAPRPSSSKSKGQED
jgi:hypothetical protein